MGRGSWTVNPKKFKFLKFEPEVPRIQKNLGSRMCDAKLINALHCRISIGKHLHLHLPCSAPFETFTPCNKCTNRCNIAIVNSLILQGRYTSAIMDRYQSLIDTFGQDHFDKVKKSHILVVGAGGIGCEILKNLVLSGFLSIEVIDLDTIDVSNLNRQFLFRTEHVGQPKAVVAAAAVRMFNPDVKIIAHYGNIKDVKFGIDYIQKFNLVLNALDNIDARRHVNRLCLATDVPMIDSGTTGYLGQVMPVFKGRTACYECVPKPTQKVYPICTIRSTPDKPVHCIVWAKELYKLLFGNRTESMLYEDAASGEASTYMDLVTFPTEIQVRKFRFLSLSLA